MKTEGCVSTETYPNHDFSNPQENYDNTEGKVCSFSSTCTKPVPKDVPGRYNIYVAVDCTGGAGNGCPHCVKNQAGAAAAWPLIGKGWCRGASGGKIAVFTDLTPLKCKERCMADSKCVARETPAADNMKGICEFYGSRAVPTSGSGHAGGQCLRKPAA